MTKKYKLSPLGHIVFASIIGAILFAFQFMLWGDATGFTAIFGTFNVVAGSVICIVLYLGNFMHHSDDKLLIKLLTTANWLWTGLLIGVPAAYLLLLGIQWIANNWQEQLIEEVKES